MRFVSLFAGVGGFDLGLELAGHECVGQVEIDKHCRQVLAKHWPDVPRHDDVRTANDWADSNDLVGRVDLVCGGFPCQDLSVAGKRAGLAGNRSGLFWDALAFTTHVQAQWLLLENVPGLLTSNQGRDFGVLITALADAGLSHIEWRVLDSQFFGVPQRRRRIFIVASAANPSGRPILTEREGSEWDSAALRAARPSAPREAEGGAAIGNGHPVGSGAYAVDFRQGAISDSVTHTIQAKSSGGYSLHFTPGVLQPPAQAAYSQTGFARYSDAPPIGTLIASDHRRPENHLVLDCDA